MSGIRIHVRNLVANWVGHGANLVVLFLLSPFIVHTLGSTEYGIWGLVTVLTGYMGIFDLGVRASTGRFIILYLGRKDPAAVDETIRTGLGLYSFAGCLIFAVSIGMGWVFPYVFKSLPPGYHGLVQLLLPVMAINFLMAAYGAVFSCVLIAHDRFDLVRSVDLVVLGVRTAGIILALKWGYGIVGLAASTVLCSLVAIVLNGILARRIYPALRVWPLTLAWTRVREMLGYGLWAFISAVSLKLIGQTDLVVVGALISVPAVTIYSVGAMLVYYTQTFMGQIGATFFPSVQRAVARGELGDARWLFFRQVRLSLLLGLPVFIGFMVFGQTFIRLWMSGPTFTENAVVQAALVMALLSLAKVVALHTVGAGGVLDAMGYVRFNALTSIADAVLNLGLSVFFVLALDWGLVGVAAGTLASRILSRMFFVPWYACRRMGVSWSMFLTRMFGRGAVVAGLVAGWYLLVRYVVPGTNWALFAAQVGLALAGYVPMGLFLLVPADDRKRLFRRLGLQPAAVVPGEDSK